MPMIETAVSTGSESFRQNRVSTFAQLDRVRALEAHARSIRSG